MILLTRGTRYFTFSLMSAQATVWCGWNSCMLAQEFWNHHRYSLCILLDPLLMVVFLPVCKHTPYKNQGFIHCINVFNNFKGSYPFDFFCNFNFELLCCHFEMASLKSSEVILQTFKPLTLFCCACCDTNPISFMSNPDNSLFLAFLVGGSECKSYRIRVAVQWFN